MVKCILAFFFGVGSAAPSRHKHRTAESTLEIYRGMLRGRRAVFCDVGGVVGVAVTQMVLDLFYEYPLVN